MKPRTLDTGFRGNTGGNIYNMVFLSAVIHFVLITAILISVPSSSRHLTFGPVYSVQLVGPDVAFPRNSSLMQDILQSRETASPMVLKKEVTSLSSTPAKKEETSKLNVEKAVSAIKQKEISPAQATSNIKPSAASANTAGANMPQAQAGSRSDEYNAFIQSRVKGNWILPQPLWPKDNIETIIEVKILRNGAVERLNFEKRSGNHYFDDSAMKAVQKSIPFPPFPDGMIDNYIERGIRFPSSELRKK